MELGSYSNSHGGRIHLNVALNAELDSMFGTVQHEVAHAWLMGTTMLGALEKLMYMEMLLSEDEDKAYSKDRKACVSVLAEHTRVVQEIYANNMELLAIEKQLGQEEMLQALKHRPEEYQNYFMEMWPVHQSSLSLLEKQRHIHALCCYAMNPMLEKDSLCNAYALAKYLQGKDNPLQRLRCAICDYQKNGAIPENSMDELDILRFAEMTLEYVRPYLRDVIEDYDQPLGNLSRESAADTIDKLMIDKICLFEPAKIRPKRVWNACDTEDAVFLAMGNVLNLQKEDSFYLIRYEGAYVGEEVDADELLRRIGKCISVCTLFSEFDIEKEKPEDFEQGQALLTVLIQTYEECTDWLRSIHGKDEVFVGELRAVGNQTDISILFFNLRGKPEKVYAFPTLRAIRNRLLQEFGLENRCYQADEAGFLSLFSWLKDEVDILKYLQGLLQLFLDRSWTDLLKSNTLRQFVAAIGNNLANQVLRIKRNDYYKIMAALPQKKTQMAPIFTLMRFDGERNTGDTYVDSDFHVPLVFLSKASADMFSVRWANDYSSVGIDRIFWPYFKSMSGKGKVVLVLDVVNRIGKIVNAGDIEILYYGEKQKS